MAENIVTTHCSRCGCGLEANFEDSTFNTISVAAEPCPNCIKVAFDACRLIVKRATTALNEGTDTFQVLSDIRFIAKHAVKNT